MIAGHAETAARHKVVTQMGNQGPLSAACAEPSNCVGGVIGEVREAHVWFDGGNGPMKRPTETPPVPEGLNWDLWLGPAQSRPYSPAYVPASWRSWRAFGQRHRGDFACHTANIMFRALHLEQLWQKSMNPGDRKVVVRLQAWPSEVDAEGYPTSLKVVMDLPARGTLPPVKYDVVCEGKAARGSDARTQTGRLGRFAGWIERIDLFRQSVERQLRAAAGEPFADFHGGPPESLPRVKSHQWEWIEACKGNGKTFSSFDTGGPLTELAQLANLATLAEGPIEYDTLSGKS